MNNNNFLSKRLDFDDDNFIIKRTSISRNVELENELLDESIDEEEFSFINEIKEHTKSYYLDVCNNLGEKIPKGGSSWELYLKEDLDKKKDIIVKYTNYTLYVSSNLDRSKDSIKKYYRNIENELNINLLLMKYKNLLENVLVPLDIGYCKGEDSPFYILFDRLETDLEKYLKKPIDINFIKKLLIDVVNGLIHLQRLNIHHKDLESRNILLDKKGNFYISDFGISKIKKDGLHGKKKFSDIAKFIKYLYKNYYIILNSLDIYLEDKESKSELAEKLYKKYTTLEFLKKHIEEIEI